MTKKKGLLGIFQKKKANIHVFHDLKAFIEGKEPNFLVHETKDKDAPGIFIFGIGSMGGAIARQVFEKLSEKKIKIFHFGIGYLGTNNPKETELFISLGEKQGDELRNYLNAYDLIEKNSAGVNEKVHELISKKGFGKTALVLFGSDSIGVGGGLYICQTLLEMDIMPIPVIMLPEKGAPLTNKFNAAVAMYKLGLAPIDSSLNIPFIIIDTNRFYEGQKVPADQILRIYPDKIASVIDDIISSLYSPTEGFDVGYPEFSSLFYYLRGPSVLFSLNGMFKELKNNLSEFVSEYLVESVSAPLDPFKSTRGYVVFQVPKNSVLAEDYLNAQQLFSNADIYWHFTTREDDQFVFRGLLTGLGAQKYIKEWMENTEKLTVRMKEREADTFIQGKPVHNIDKLEGISPADADFSVEEMKE